MMNTRERETATVVRFDTSDERTENGKVKSLLTCSNTMKRFLQGTVQSGFIIKKLVLLSGHTVFWRYQIKYFEASRLYFLLSLGIGMEWPLQSSCLIGVRDFSSPWLIWFNLSFVNSFRRISTFFVSIAPSMATNYSSGSVPLVGRIYELRQSVRRAFGVSDEESTKSSVSSTDSPASDCQSGSISTKSSRKKRPKRPHTRSCLLWTKAENTCSLLLITTFDSTDPLADEKVASSFSTTRKELSKRIMAIHNTKPIVGRPSIRFQTMPASHDNLDPNRENYLVLIPPRRKITGLCKSL